MTEIFDVPVFFIVFRETLETAVVVSVLLANLRRSLGGGEHPDLYTRLRRQILLGAAVGFITCLILGGSLVGTFYILGTDKWSENEYMWEGIFGVISSAIITVMGVAMLRISKLQAKWRLKLLNSLEVGKESTGTLGERFKAWCENHALFILPFVTILREGIEAIVFVGGVTIGRPASSVPLPTLLGLAAGCVIGYAIFKGGDMASLRLFLTISTCFLYHVAAGLLSRAVWFFEADQWNKLTGGDAAENGSGPGSYDIRRSVWHVNCCNPQLNGGGWWGVFNSLLGWQNSATYGSVISYNAYWLVVMIGFIWLRFKEIRGKSAIS